MEWTIPNILSLYRIIAAPFLVLTGWLGQPTLFYILLGSMLITDALDGIIARILNQTSDLGARLDTYGDILTYISTLLAVWWLWPHIIKNELNYMLAAALFYMIPALLSLVKFGKLASMSSGRSPFSNRPTISSNSPPISSPTSAFISRNTRPNVRGSA